MKRKVSLLLFTALLAFAVPALAADEALLGFTGYDFKTPAGGTYLAIGDSYQAVGFVTYFNPTWLQPYVDPGANEYTFYQHGLVVNSYSFSGNFLFVTFANGGSVEYYEDPSFDATNPPNPPNCPRYGNNPPNATSPSTFSNGTLAISGSLANATLYYDYNSNQGAFGADMTITGGVDAVYVPPGSWSGWFMSGLFNTPSGPCAPAGYDHILSGECRHPVTATTGKTWGALKKLYR
ncbi:MAG: hypothetical protein HY076_03170 [Candidatus Eisenbacteria bacterium]|uniref:Uncharacterized protein n=1 Tax=Eiseniibacteriota bacterium TaxID=2212470 RepID=A0A9D6QJH2_UNCEI|nr:hypothetical protein [Candidatus Eisenbacteria bacterium]MBI3539255.1 hypothetical protein [Candidatus Eisenbacteria bacterium]